MGLWSRAFGVPFPLPKRCVRWVWMGVLLGSQTGFGLFPAQGAAMVHAAVQVEHVLHSTAGTMARFEGVVVMLDVGGRSLGVKDPSGEIWVSLKPTPEGAPSETWPLVGQRVRCVGEVKHMGGGRSYPPCDRWFRGSSWGV